MSSEHDKYYNHIPLGSYGFKNPITNTTARTLSVNAKVNKMSTIREQVENYVPVETLNISELKKVSTEVDIQLKEGTTGEGKAFSYFYIIVDDKQYRVPNSVLKQVRGQLDAKPESTLFKVNKTGEGLKTEYTVIMLD